MEPRAKELPKVTLMGFLGIIMLVLGGLPALGALVMIPIIRAMDAPCPPGAVCDGAGLLTFVCVAVAIVGAIVAAVGGLMLSNGQKR